MSDELTFRPVVVTCHTDQCENADIPLTLDVLDVPDPAVFCGPCGEPITDIKDPEAPEQA